MSKIRKALEVPAVKRVKCSYCEWLLQMDADDRAAVLEFYASPLSTAEMMRRLQPFGLPVSHHSVLEHRQGKHRNNL